MLGEHGDIETLSSARDASRGRQLTAFLIVMEFANGGSLDGPASTYHQDIIADDARFGEFFSHMSDVCVALKAAHDEQDPLIHSDIKPHNIFYFRGQNGNSQVKLGDFGIARRENESPQAAASLLGTPEYMAPELHNGNPSSKKSDVYALGCTFFEVLTGRQAFSIDEQALSDLAARHNNRLLAKLELFRDAHNNSPRPNARPYAPKISIPFNNLLIQMMAVDPNQRPSLDEVISALEEERTRQTIEIDLDVRVADELKLPSEKFLSKFYVSPWFRRVCLNEWAYFLFLNIQPRSQEKMKALYKVLGDHFKDTFSLYEVYGRCDFLARVWSDQNRMDRALEVLRARLLTNDADSLSYLVSDDVRYLSAKFEADDVKVDASEAQIKLHAAQVLHDKSAVRWLTKHKVYLGHRSERRKPGWVKCYCFVHARTGSGNVHDRENQSILLRESIKKARLNGDLEVTLYRKRYQQPEDAKLGEEHIEHIISYLSPTFDKAIQIPELIIERVQQYKFRTTTMLCTNRYFVHSDQVLFM